MVNRYVLKTIIGRVVCFIAFKAFMNNGNDATVIMLVESGIWTGLQFGINLRIKIDAKDHPEMASSYVEK